MKIFSLLEMKLALRLRSGQAMKQTAAVSIGILGLNEDFVQMNEIMGYENTQKYLELLIKLVFLQSNLSKL
jgi:hypothetical protein